MKKQIKFEITKTKDGYSIVDEANSVIGYYSDEDSARKAFLSYIVDNMMNIEVTGGKEYN
jgi:hypothetical protein